MSPREIEQAINNIAWGGKHIRVKTFDGCEIVTIKPLSISDKNFLDFIYDAALGEALESGVMNKFELYKLYKERGVWTNEDDDNHKVYIAKIKELKTLLGNLENVERKKTQVQISFFEKELDKINLKRRELYNVSAENYAEEQKLLALAFCATHDLHDKKKWDKWDDFLSSVDLKLIDDILHGIINIEQYSEKQIRAIARSSTWRYRWNAAKSIGDLFGKPIMDFSPTQQSLIYWSQVYDNVYESMEKPPDEIINDDVALDRWFEAQAKKRKTKDVEKTGKVGKINMSNKMRSHGEVGIVAGQQVRNQHGEIINLPSREDVDELNPELVRTFRRAEWNKIKKAGDIREQDLRKRGDHIARKLIGSKDAVLGQSKFGQQRKSGGKTLPGGTL